MAYAKVTSHLAMNVHSDIHATCINARNVQPDYAVKTNPLDSQLNQLVSIYG